MPVKTVSHTHHQTLGIFSVKQGKNENVTGLCCMSRGWSHESAAGLTGNLQLDNIIQETQLSMFMCGANSPSRASCWELLPTDQIIKWADAIAGHLQGMATCITVAPSTAQIHDSTVFQLMSLGWLTRQVEKRRKPIEVEEMKDEDNIQLICWLVFSIRDRCQWCTCLELRSCQVLYSWTLKWDTVRTVWYAGQLKASF